MKIVLVGPPNSKKRMWAKNIQQKYPHLGITKQPRYVLKHHHINGALGKLADYRTEILLASLRSLQQVSLDDCIFVHSPIDSYAHITARLQQRSDVTADNDDWLLSLLVSGLMLNDSFQADQIYRVKKGTFNNHFERIVDAALTEILTELKIDPLPVEDAV